METKRCSTCGKQKSLDQFNRNRNSVDGHLARCKLCDRTVRLARYRANPRVRARFVWHTLLQRVNNANGKNPSYANVSVTFSQDEFIDWYANELPKFFMTYGNDNTPSVDRIRETKNYSPGNVRLIPLAENARRSKNKRNVNAPKGKAWCTHCKKYLPREQFHKNKAQSHGLQHSCKKHKKIRS